MSTNAVAERDDRSPAARPPRPGPRPTRALRLGLAVGWTLIIMGLCWMPLSVVEEVTQGSRWFDIPDLDKVVHWSIFVVFAVLWLRLSTSRWRFALVGLGGLALAIVTEVVQTHPSIGRTGELDDGITDMIGVAIACVLSRWIEPLLAWIEARLPGGRAG